METGFIERVLFGDWSLDLKAGKDARFSAKFVARRVAETKVGSNEIISKFTPVITINNLKVNGFQRNNEDVVLRGMVDVSLQTENMEQNRTVWTKPEINGTPLISSTDSWEKAQVSIAIVSNSSVIIISFDKYSPVNEIFIILPL